MNRYLLKQNIIGLLFFTCLFVGCDNAEYSVLHNQAYISQTGTNPNTALKVFIDQDLVTANLNVRLSDPAEKDYNFEFVEDAELLAKYNEVNYTSYKFLPAEQYNFKGKEAVIKQGEVLSESSGLEILPLTQEMKDSGNKYAIALTLQSKDGTTEVLKPGSTILYLLDPAIVTSVPVFNSRHNVAFSLIEDLSLSEWTLEFCVNMSKLGKKVGELNNQALFGGYWWLAKSCPLLSLLIVLNQHFIKSCTMRQNFDGTKMGQNRRKIKPRPLCSEYPYQNTLILNTKVQICPVINEPMSLFLSSITHFSIILYHGRFFKVLDTLFHILQLNNVFLIVVQCSERLPIIETAHLYTPFVRLDSDFSVVMKCVALFPSMANCHLKVSHKDVVNCMLNQ